MSNMTKKAILLFELGHLQVFHYQTIDEWATGISPAQIFWLKKGENKIYGPFVSIYQAVCNYTASLVKSNPMIEGKDNVIHVDFKAKKRLPK